MSKNYEQFSDYLEYDENSITKLKWKPEFVKGAAKKEYAGSPERHSIVVNYKHYSIKDVVWLLHNESLPSGVIHHIDGDISNNSIENLYEYVHKQYDSKLGEHLKEYFKYDENSPSKLIWIKKYGKTGSNVTIGDNAGSLDTQNGYWKIHALGNNMKCHRIVWYLFNGDIPKGKHIDHINGNRSDNSISNLRLVEQAINARNCKMSENNTSGVTGVSYFEGFTRNGTPFSKFYVSVSYNRKVFRRSFSCEKYGYDQAFQLACEYRAKMIEELNAQGAGYTPRHGKE